MNDRTKRTVFLIVGFVLDITGSATGNVILGLVGTVLWFWGCYLWVKLKNRHWSFTFLGLLTWLGVLIIYLLPDKSYNSLPKDELQRSSGWLRYLQEEWKLKSFQEKEADLYNNALVKYGGLMTTNSLASKEMCRAASRLAQSASEILKRRGEMAYPPLTSAMYLKWQITYSDYLAWASAQCSAIEAAAEGMIPDAKRVKELLSQSEKSRSQAEKEERELIKWLNLSIEDINKILSDASAAVEIDNWQPREPREFNKA